MLEVLIAGRLAEGGPDKQVTDPAAAEGEREEGVQLVPGPRGTGIPALVAEHGEEHRELDVVLDLLFGSAYHRLLQGHRPLTDQFARRVTDLIVAGVTAPGA
jgi:hypothetical protein